MEIIGKIKNIVAKPKNHLIFLEGKEKYMLSAFGSNKGLVEGKTYKFQCEQKGDFINYDKKKVVMVVDFDGEHIFTGKFPTKITPIVEMIPRITKESTKTSESMECVKKYREKLNGQAFGMLFNNTILLLINQGRSTVIHKYFDTVFDELLVLHEKKRKELGVQ